MSVREQLHSMSQETAGKAGVVIGGGGLTVQALTSGLSISLLVVNLLLAIGGAYLMWPKIKERWRLDRERKRRQTDKE